MNKKISSFLKKNKIILIVLAAALIARLVFFFGFQEIWWDSGVYVGMGKYLFSLGKAGLWEHIRPIFWPFTLGFLWFVKLSPVLFGRMLEIILSLGIVYMVYLIASVYFGKKSALIASLIVAFSSIFFYFGFRLYSEIPAIFLALLGIYFFTKERHYLAGLFVGLAFASKFPAGVFIVCLGISLLFLKPDLKKYAYLTAGFSTVAVPYLIFNYFTSGSFVQPFVDASNVIRKVLGCNVLRYKPVYYYLYLPLIDNFLNIFSLVGIYSYFKRSSRKKLLPFLCLLIPFLYFTQLNCRDSRYFLIFMPFLAMFSGYGIWMSFNRFCSKSRKKRFFVYLIVLVLLVSAVWSISYYLYVARPYPADAEENYLRFLEDKDAKGEVWSSNPIISVYSDDFIHKVYYPVYESGIAIYFSDYLQKNAARMSYVLLDNCGGGIICAEGDYVCRQQTENIFSFLSSFDLVYNQSHGRCYYRIYQLD